MPNHTDSDPSNPDERLGYPSASGMERLMLCPGSWQLECGLVELEPPSRFALDGTMLHEVLAGMRSEARLTERQLWIVHQCRELLSQVERQLGFSLESDTARALVEERIWFYDEDNRSVFSGQMDYAIVEGNRGLVVDYKTGAGPVTRSGENYQMRAQAVLLAHNFELDEVYVAIIQPLAEENVAVARYGPEELRLAEADVLAGIEAASAYQPVRIVGERQCRFCKAKSICPEARQQALTLVPFQDTMPARKFSVPTLSPEQLGELLPKLEIAERIIREIRKQAKEMLQQSPDAVEGYELRRGAERRTIADTEEAYRRLSAILTPEQFAACCTVQIGKLEETLRETLGETARDTREMMTGLLGDTMERKPTEPILERTSPK